MNLAEQPVKIQLRGSSSAGTGPDLVGYPHLTYAPSQWGPGVRVASNGANVGAIAADAKSIISEVDALARREGISLDELCDALRYARANGAI